ncbi:tetratricopeptide repeat protein [Streptomyces sp. NBC_00659]|uniref:AfsR/SARP family transcriptional regulator n=1 Tax=Streptomyces sp. NBC_00659 TaxID=2903669 RepID=UPI002E313A4B|nr:BTAD domain-containing putative transcriptional regulator [Streptomyces sp. NBC_00659]
MDDVGAGTGKAEDMPTGVTKDSGTTSERGELWFSVLGPVRASRDGTALELGPPQQRGLLALLLARPGQPLEVEQIVDALWGEEPPVSALTLVYRHIGLLRRTLEPDLPARAPGGWLLRGAGGYRIEADADSLDLLRFRQLAREARRVRDDGATRRSVAMYVEALALWTGHPLDGLPPFMHTAPAFKALDREHHAVVKEAADAALHCGLVSELLGPLRRCAAERPLDEPLHARLLYALMATDRVQEALRTYRAVKAKLADELGIGPGEELRSAARHLLGQPTSVPTPTGVSAPVAPAPATVGPAPSSTVPRPAGRASVAYSVPAQLPPGLPVFVGRKRELALVSGPGAADGPAAVIVLSGPPGVGKTALAGRWAHRAAPGFPDGQLYANLRGHTPGAPPADPAVILGGFLRALGLPPERIPGKERPRRYREALAGRRVLVFLDDVRDAAQIRDLLPDVTGCLAVVTSRGPLREIAGGERDSRFLDLAPFDADEARDCLAARLGGERVAAEEDAVRELTVLTGGLPLALAAAAARASAGPAFPLAALAEEIRSASGGLDAVPEVRAALDASCRTLTPGAARVFRLLAACPGTTISTAAAASAAALPVERVRHPLGELVRAGLLTERLGDRYHRARLVGTYAHELARPDEHETATTAPGPAEDGEPDGRGGEPRVPRDDVQPDAEASRLALRRVLDHHLHTARNALARLSPHRTVPAPPPALPGVSTLEHGSAAQALAWCGAEIRGLVDLVSLASRHGFHDHTWRLARLVELLLDQQGLRHDAVEPRRAALDSARHLCDPVALAHAYSSLGELTGRLGRTQDAHIHLRRARELFGELGDLPGQGDVHRRLSRLYEGQGRLDEALSHAERAVERHRGAVDRVGESGALLALARILRLLGRHRDAFAVTRQALEALHGLAEPHAEAAVRGALGRCHDALGNHRRALLAHRRALTLYRAAGDGHHEFRCLVRIGEAHRAAADPGAARTAWARALAVRDTLDHETPEVREAAALLRTRIRDLPPQDDTGAEPPARPSLRLVSDAST